MLPRKRPGGRGRRDLPNTPTKRFKFGSPRGQHPPLFDHPGHSRDPRYSSSSEDLDFPPPIPFPKDLDLPLPPPFPFRKEFQHPLSQREDFSHPSPKSSCHSHSHRSRSPSIDEVLFMDLGGEWQSTPPPPPPPPPPPQPVTSLDHHKEFDYLYKYGHIDRQERSHSKTQRQYSTASSGYASDHAPVEHHLRRRQTSDEQAIVSCPEKGRDGCSKSGGFLGGKGTEDKWAVIQGSPRRGAPRGHSSSRGQGHPRGQDSTRSHGLAWGRGIIRGATSTRGQGQPSSRGQFSARGQGPSRGHGHVTAPPIQHKPLPPAKPVNALYMSQLHTGIHSLASKKPDPIHMSMPEKLLRFMVFLRNETPRVNDIQTVENAITGCHLDLKTVYEAEEVGIYQNRRIFSGRLVLSDIFLARAVGHTKKELKHECYKLALEVLKTKEVHQILQQKDVGIEAIRKTFEECSANKDSGKPSGAQKNPTTARLAHAAPIAVALETVATPEERWSEFLCFVKGHAAQAVNAICRIEMALSASRCGLDRNYSDCTIQLSAKPAFQGSLTIGGILQAQGEGSKKKEAKQKTYELAQERFMTLQLPEILQGIEPKAPEEVVSCEDKPKNIVVKEIRTPEQIKRLEIFIDRIKDSTVQEGPVTVMDVMASQLQLFITCVYRRMNTDGVYIYSCQMYIGDLLISEGEGKQRKETQLDAYSKAYERLISTPLEKIMSESHRLDQADLEDPEIADIVIKGQIRQTESNLSRLRKQHANLEEVLSEKQACSMVIVEHEDWVHDRKKHSFCILQNSAIMNIMLMEWNMDAQTGFFNCKMSVQGEELGSARAGSKQVARNLAAADVLFKMYETHPVLRIIATEDTENWITRDQMMQRMKEMPESEFAEVITLETASQAQGSDAKSNTKDEEKEGSYVVDTADDEKESRIKLRAVAQRMINEFIQRGDVLEEMAFSPELPVSIRRTLPTVICKQGLRAHQRQKDGKFYLAITFRTRIDKIVEAMLKRGVKKTSRFLLIEDRSELPCHADIIPDIEAARNAPRKLDSAPRGILHPSANRDGGSGGGSLNGSLFEDTVDGFVTAQSSFLAEGNSSTIQPVLKPAVQSTPVKDSKDVYSDFVEAMTAAGVGQTLVVRMDSTGSSTQVAHDANTTPPLPRSGSNSWGAAMSKNILVSPPTPSSGSVPVTIAAPKQNLTVSSIPLPKSSTTTTTKGTTPAQQNSTKTRQSTVCAASNSSNIPCVSALQAGSQNQYHASAGSQRHGAQNYSSSRHHGDHSSDSADSHYYPQYSAYHFQQGDNFQDPEWSLSVISGDYGSCQVDPSRASVPYQTTATHPELCQSAGCAPSQRTYPSVSVVVENETEMCGPSNARRRNHRN